MLSDLKHRFRAIPWGRAADHDVVRDLQFAYRSLRRTPGATGVAVLSLAVSIGVTAAVYGTVDWLLNRVPGGVVDPDRLVILNLQDDDDPDRIGPFSYQQFEDLTRLQDAFEGVATYAKATGVAGSDDVTEQVVFEWVSGNYFSILGVQPVVGRTFVPEDDVEGAPVVALLSEAFWHSKFADDPNVLERPLQLNGAPARIVGVIPADFEGFQLDWQGPTDIWIPVHAVNPMGGNLLTEGGQQVAFVPVFGRLPADMTLAEAIGRAQAWVPQLRPHFERPDYQPTRIVGIPASEMRITRREEARAFLYVLLVVCGLLLLAACFNVANFLVGRAASRRGEIALRASLGASRPRLFRQLLTEAALLGVVAVVLGLVAAVITAQSLAGLPRVYLNLPITAARLSTSGAIDFQMVGVTAALGIVCVLLFGLLPSLMATMRNPIADLKHGSANWSWSRMRITTRHVLLVLQIALGVALSVTAGLYAQSFRRAANVTMGYQQPESVLVARVIGAGPLLDDERAFYRSLLQRVNEASEVHAASLGFTFPFAAFTVPVSLPGQEQDLLRVRAAGGSPGYFASHGVRLVAGREFTFDGDDLESSVIINRELANRFWPNGAAVGEALMWGGKQRRTVVGVVTDDYCAGPLEGRIPCAWTPVGLGGNTMVLRAHTRVPPLEFLPSLRQLARQIDPKVAISEAYVFEDYMREATARQRVASVICSALALLGVCLVAFGCASLYASLVRDSAREIAIRMALGADATRLFRRIVAHGLYLAAIGGILGLAGGWIVGRRIADQLYQTPTTDPVVFVGAPGLVALTVLVSLAIPAAAAVRRNPIQHLRRD